MGQNPDGKHPSQQIVRRLRDRIEPVEQIDKEKDDQSCPEDPQLFADDGKYVIIIGLRNLSKLLDAVAQSLAPQSAGTDGIQSLQGLIRLALLIFIGKEPGPDTHQTEIDLVHLRRVQIFHIVQDACHQRRGSRRAQEEFPLLRVYHIDHEHRRSQKDCRRTHIVADDQDQGGYDGRGDDHTDHGHPAPQLLPPHHNQSRHKDNHDQLDGLRHLELYGTDPQPSGGSLYCHSQGRYFQKQHQGAAEDIARQHQKAPHMIIDTGHHQHGCNSQKAVSDLRLQKIHGIIIVSLAEPGRIITGAVKHDKAEDHEEEQHYQKIRVQSPEAEVKEALPLLSRHSQASRLS